VGVRRGSRESRWVACSVVDPKLFFQDPTKFFSMGGKRKFWKQNRSKNFDYIEEIFKAYL